MSAESDKRKQRRIPVELWIEAARDGELYFQRASNLSIGGAYFTQTVPLPLGSKVALKFSLPNDQHEIVCDGEIVTAKDLGMGVLFVGIKAADQQRIEKLIDLHEKSVKATAKRMTPSSTRKL